MFVASFFNTVVIQPIFNLLVLIQALIPGHNFGLAIILFTIIIRLLMWPLVKKQLHQARAMRELQPELKRIKKETKGDRQKESVLLMELYKEKGISPFGSIGVLIIQVIILIGLYEGLRRVVADPNYLITTAYAPLRHLGWVQSLAADISRFDASLFGVIDLARNPLSNNVFYWPGIVLVAASAVTQYYQSKQLMPAPKDGRGLRAILKEAGAGKSADQSEVSAAVGRSTRFFIPVMIFVFTIGIPTALSLYWFVSGLIAYLQQDRILRQDEHEMEVLADAPASKKSIIEGEVVSKQPATNKPKKKSSKAKQTKKRRK